MSAIMVDADVTTGLAGGSNEENKGGIRDTSKAAAPQRGAPASPVPPGGEKELKTDIAKILQEVKLPERRDAHGAADKKPPTQIEISPLLSDTPPQNPPTAPQAAPSRPPTTPPTPQKQVPPPQSPPTAPATTPPPSVRPGAPVAVPTPPAQQQQSAPAQAQKPIVSVHTLKDDLRGVVREQKISVVRAAALEQEKRGTPEHIPESQYGSKVRGVLFAVLLLALLGVAALGGVYFFVSNSAPEAATPASSNTLVFAEKSIPFPVNAGSPANLKLQIANVRNSTGAALGTITRVVPIIPDTIGSAQSVRPATLQEFFTALGIRPPEELMRALSQEFFLGVHTVDKNAPVIVIPVLSYEHAFAGMLTWEKTMNTDLAPLFTPVPALIVQDGIPTERTFTDDVFRNYDVRKLTDDAGTTVLYYSFPTRNTLIIAESPYTFTEMLTRLQALNNL